MMQNPVNACHAFPTGVYTHLSTYRARKVHPPGAGKCAKDHDVHNDLEDSDMQVADMGSGPVKLNSIGRTEYFDIFTDCDSEIQSTCSTWEWGCASDVLFCAYVETCSKGVNTDIVCVDEMVCGKAECIGPGAISNVEFFDIYTPLYTDCESESQSTCSAFEHRDFECSSASELSSGKSVETPYHGLGLHDKSQKCSTELGGQMNMDSEPAKANVSGKVEYFKIHTPLDTDCESENQSTCSTCEETDVERSSNSDLSSGEGEDELDNMCRACAEHSPDMCRTCADSAEDWFADLIEEINSEHPSSPFTMLADPRATIKRQSNSAVTRSFGCVRQHPQPFRSQWFVTKPKGQLPQTNIQALRTWAERDRVALERIQEVPVPNDDGG